MEEFGKAKEEWLKKFLRLPEEILPSTPSTAFFPPLI
jgi:hypothetical protein